MMSSTIADMRHPRPSGSVVRNRTVWPLPIASKHRNTAGNTTNACIEAAACAVCDLISVRSDERSRRDWLTPSSARDVPASFRLASASAAATIRTSAWGTRSAHDRNACPGGWPLPIAPSTNSSSRASGGRLSAAASVTDCMSEAPLRSDRPTLSTKSGNAATKPCVRRPDHRHATETGTATTNTAMTRPSANPTTSDAVATRTTPSPTQSRSAPMWSSFSSASIANVDTGAGRRAHTQFEPAVP